MVVTCSNARKPQLPPISKKQDITSAMIHNKVGAKAKGRKAVNRNAKGIGKAKVAVNFDVAAKDVLAFEGMAAVGEARDPLMHQRCLNGAVLQVSRRRVMCPQELWES
jgi:hypothetical protein